MKRTVRHFFVPCQENTYAPHALQRVSVAIMFVLVGITFTATNFYALLWMSSDWLVGAVLPAIIVELTNEERTHEAQTVLTRNALLDEAARRKAEDMAKNEYFAHTSPDGVSPWYWFDEVGYSFIHAGENLAVHFTESDDVVAAWMDSPGHRANILKDVYTEIGVGTAKGEYKGFPTVFVVQLFGTPAGAVRTIGTNVATTSEAENETVTTNDTVVVASAQQDVVPDRSIEDVTVTTTDTSVIVQSDFATTSRQGNMSLENGVPPTEVVDQSMPTPFERVALNPSTVLQVVYVLLGLFVLALLILSIVIEWKRQHPVQLAYGFGLLGTMCVLFYVHMILTSTVTII